MGGLQDRCLTSRLPLSTMRINMDGRATADDSIFLFFSSVKLKNLLYIHARLLLQYGESDLTCDDATCAKSFE